MGYIKTSSMPKDLIFAIKAISTDFDATGYYKPNRRLHMCNGQDSTIDLRNRFLYGASGSSGGTGGAASHYHDITGSTGTSYESLLGTVYEARAPDILANAEDERATYESTTEGHSHTLSLNTDNKSNLPPYYKIYFVQVIE